ncbi:Helicase-like transcription factor CHR28 [Camellia lanceoleosa]|uniref:Helicase-like transcription factor CHR28 n=1 Tax=Camellia lanceoleosa TaxID=1840588 RepID=A0ACC0GN90_9ERIC|nr:Helicase-like transcription factor CHR28 [Camellia lanceoleosa]
MLKHRADLQRNKPWTLSDLGYGWPSSSIESDTNPCEEDNSRIDSEYAAAGTVKQNYVNILLMLLRLRQACDHLLLVRGYNSSSTWRSSIEMAKKLPRDKQVCLLNCLHKVKALVDFAVLIRSLKKNHSFDESPIVVFGGSYGGSKLSDGTSCGRGKIKKIGVRVLALLFSLSPRPSLGCLLPAFGSLKDLNELYWAHIITYVYIYALQLSGQNGFDAVEKYMDASATMPMWGLEMFCNI